jgi:hypothetical protein
MSSLGRALAPYLYPGPGRTYYGYCKSGHKLYLDEVGWDRLKAATAREEINGLPDAPCRVVALLLPCGDIEEFAKQCYKRSDGTYFYA